MNGDFGNASMKKGFKRNVLSGFGCFFVFVTDIGLMSSLNCAECNVNLCANLTDLSARKRICIPWFLPFKEIGPDVYNSFLDCVKPEGLKQMRTFQSH